MNRWNSPCARPQCQLPAAIHFNGESYCSSACLEAAQAEERTLRGEARLRMEQGRDARGQISAQLSCLLAIVVAGAIYLSSFDRPVKRWQGPRLIAMQKGGTR